MKLRHLAAWFSGVVLLGTGATLLRAQPASGPREPRARNDRGELRAEIVRLRTEVEMLRFDDDLARDGLLEDVKAEKSLKMAGQMIGFGFALNNAINNAIDESIERPPVVTEKPPVISPRPKSEQDWKREAEAAKAEEQEEKKLAATIPERKKELARRFTLLSEKRLDLEDAERDCRETSRR